MPANFTTIVSCRPHQLRSCIQNCPIIVGNKATIRGSFLGTFLARHVSRVESDDHVLKGGGTGVFDIAQRLGSTFSNVRIRSSSTAVRGSTARGSLISPNASAALRLTLAFVSFSAVISGSTAWGFLISASALAAPCRTWKSLSPKATIRGSTAGPPIGPTPQPPSVGHQNPCPSVRRSTDLRGQSVHTQPVQAGIRRGTQIPQGISLLVCRKRRTFNETMKTPSKGNRRQDIRM